MLLLACVPPGPADSEPAETAAPCTPVAAMFFDLGETLVTEQEDGLFANIPEAIALLDALTANAMPMGLITNVLEDDDRDDLAALLVDPSLLDRFDVLLLSSEAESRPKPNRHIFEEAVNLLADVPPIEQTVFVTEEIGDLADEDPPSRGAQAAGMIGVHVSGEAPSDLVDETVLPADLASLAAADWVECLEER